MTLFCYDHVTLTVYMVKMAVVKYPDCYVFCDNILSLFEALEEYDVFELDPSYTTNKTSIS